MIVLDGFWPDEIESFSSNTDLSMNGMQIFTYTKATFDAYGGFSGCYCSEDNSTTSGVTISKGMVSESKMVFSLGLGASLQVRKALDITSSAKKSKFKYKLKFREPTDFAGNPFMCGSTACPSMPPMKGEVKIRFPKVDDTNKDYGVGPFEGVKVDDGTEVDVREVSKLDSQKDITISASKVTMQPSIPFMSSVQERKLQPCTNLPSSGKCVCRMLQSTGVEDSRNTITNWTFL